ncbi:MAG: hypothetical protein M9886_05070 [Candidatus Nanopelagicales bacterium]|uniref:hypothetical protein n=1 Tax=Rhodococcus pyridinivorans TaxID=103816 RepID=UPI002658B0D4|nr:hypothetical protein [Rhodococcus pyridinivorans]MCO5299305.1 hypothetical protein [Candidatus Nanopelagicales bacterium]HPE12360.1 hypothetical protein [Actinomycetota bacterium]HRV64762.1 hypothetical protein [Candidatus Nanopelagicales bacterium]
MRKPEPESVPVSIPLVLLVVHEDGTVSATVDGKPLEPDPFAPPWRRSSFGPIIDRATNDRTAPVRVEVHESDGTTFTDIIAPSRHRADHPKLPAENPISLPTFHAVEGDGFVPGEDVAVAIVTGHTDAAHTGRARALIDPAQLGHAVADGFVEVLLFGRISGTTIARRLS